MRNKKAQGQVMGMSFGTIFSILLIIFFIIIAFVVINAFLKSQKCTQIGLFVDGLGDEIETTWNSQGGDFPYPSTLPSNLDYVCFANLSDDFYGEHKDKGDEFRFYQRQDSNLILYPIKKACIAYHNIEHLDISKITQSENPYCIPVDKGNIDIQIKKGFNEALVSLS